MFLPHPRVKVSIAGSLRDREVACSASDRQGSNFESCVWRTVSSQSSHHPQEVLLAQFSLPHCDKTIIIGVIYNPPVGSRYKDINFFENLETTLMNISNTKRYKSIMLIGDFNARTGNLEDTLEYNNEDDSEELNTVHYLKTANAATQRSNTDLNSYNSVKI